MVRLFRRHAHFPGASPGWIPPKERSAPARLVSVNYSKDTLERDELRSSDDWAPVNRVDCVTWVHVEGVDDVSSITSLGASFKLHPLVLEAIASSGQRPREEDYGDYLFVALRALRRDGRGAPVSEGFNLVLGPEWVLSFAETTNSLLESLWQQISVETSRVRSSGPDYLAYRIIDIVVDQFFGPLEEIGDALDAVDDALMAGNGRGVLTEIYRVKRQLMVMRKALWPTRDLLLRLERLETPLIRRETRIFLRDARDHAVQVADTVGLYQEMASAMLEVHLSLQSNRMNEVMKVLTIIATIFMPLGFLAGLYGMNFKHMPELEQSWGYPAVLVVMLGVAVGMLYFFRRKHWL